MPIPPPPQKHTHTQNHNPEKEKEITPTTEKKVYTLSRKVDNTITPLNFEYTWIKLGTIEISVFH
jgi:hypothetical protein